MSESQVSVQVVAEDWWRYAGRAVMRKLFTVQTSEWLAAKQFLVSVAGVRLYGEHRSFNLDTGCWHVEILVSPLGEPCRSSSLVWFGSTPDQMQEAAMREGWTFSEMFHKPENTAQGAHVEGD